MTDLTNNQKKFLRSKGHSLKPIVMVGNKGLTEAVSAEIASTITKHELLKIRICADNRDAKQAIIEKIIDQTTANLIQVIGNIIVIYHPFAEDQKIILPRK